MITLRELGAIGSGTDLSADYVDARRALAARDRWRASRRAWRGEAAWDEASARWAIVWVRQSKRVPLVSGAALIGLGAFFVLGLTIFGIVIAPERPVAGAIYVAVAIVIAWSITRSVGVQRRGDQAIARNAELLGGEIPPERASLPPTRLVRIVAVGYMFAVFVVVRFAFGELLDLDDAAWGLVLQGVVFTAILVWAASRRRKRREAERARPPLGDPSKSESGLGGF